MARRGRRQAAGSPGARRLQRAVEIVTIDGCGDIDHVVQRIDAQRQYAAVITERSRRGDAPRAQFIVQLFGQGGGVDPVLAAVDHDRVRRRRRGEREGLFVDEKIARRRDAGRLEAPREHAVAQAADHARRLLQIEAV